MATSLAEIRARLAAQENRQAGGNKPTGEQVIYPHWNIAEGTSARLRFLPDGDNKNDFFWVERLMINLPFAGIKGQADSKPVTVQVPCMEMYGRDVPCPVLAEVRPWFKDPSLEDMGRKYWKKKSYLFQGFVRDNPLSDDRQPESPIRRFVISPQIFNLVKAALMDPELENLPTDFESGLDFTVTKTTKGGYADYSTSKWSRKESSLTPDERAAIEKYGLFNLAEFLPKKPGAEELRVIKEMFEASVDGAAYDPDRWANFYKPRGLQVGSGTDGDNVENREAKPVQVAVQRPAPTPVQHSAPVVDDIDDEPAETNAPVVTPAANADSGKRAQDILAMIRNRQPK